VEVILYLVKISRKGRISVKGSRPHMNSLVHGRR
jgi:hypothetical protein